MGVRDYGKEANANRHPARHTGHADTPNPCAGSGPRAHHRLRHRAALGRSSTGRARIALSRAASPGRPRLDSLLLGHVRLSHSTLLFFGAALKTFVRDEDNRYALDPAEVRRAITPKTKLIVLTNLHNPSSVLASDSVLREIGDLARSVGARVLVDEVYLAAVYTDTPKSSYHLGPEFIVTTSLTKVY